MYVLTCSVNFFLVYNLCEHESKIYVEIFLVSDSGLNEVFKEVRKYGKLQKKKKSLLLLLHRFRL